ncbi:sigma-54-dependent Fis family transcriptional regulator [Streptomyces tendae]|uniref:sigma-54-dependent Fis family transcriptional regulator n=1 Tax=Streptomyces tendae TaxID=1932 RepID=UPI0037155967
MTSMAQPFDRAPVVRVGAVPDAQIQSLRERFLADPLATDLSDLRPVIARSWQRSLACNVGTNASFLEASEPRADEQLLLAAGPVLSYLERLSVDIGGSVVLADADGTLAVYRGDPGERRRAERVFPTLGGRFGEDVAGTNSDGTVLEEGSAVQVWGPEHFNEALQNSYCTSVPIRDPLRRSIRGVLSLMLPEHVARDTDPRSVLMTVHGAAADITQRLADRLAAREQALMSEYVREARKRGAEAVIAMDESTTIASRQALSMLDQSDFSVLSAMARETERGEPAQHRINVSAGHEVLLHIRPMELPEFGSRGAAIMRVQVPPEERRRTLPGAVPVPQAESFEGMIGTSRPLRRALDAASTAASRRMPAYIVGETGTGKKSLGRAIASRMSDGVVVFDFAGERHSADVVEEVDAALARGEAAVLHRVERASGPVRDELAALLKLLEQPQLVLTAGHVSDEILPVLSGLRGIEVSMPALRDRRSDIPALTEYFLRTGDGHARRLSTKLRDALVAADWPGNVGQLRELVESISARAELEEARLADLTDVQLRALNTARLTRLEEVELQQIRSALAEAGGNRVKASALLGIGRSTLYRKIEAYTGRGFNLYLG